ncbi:MAG: chaperonin family protein RbcX [Rhizonema sp. PD38]|nr:chaperonin family protein RbcX [Rhizonema sp. PD38]
MNIKQIAKDTAKMLQNYLTYQAVKTVLAQLSETNPPLALWLQYFSADKLQDGEPYIEELFREKPDLALRIMIVREHLAEEVTEYLPEMVRTGIMQANMEHRRQHLERSTQLQTFDPLSTSQEQATSDPSSEDL